MTLFFCLLLKLSFQVLIKDPKLFVLPGWNDVVWKFKVHLKVATKYG